MSARDDFERLYSTVEEIKTVFEEREQVKEELEELRREAKQFFSDTVERYRSEEERLEQRKGQEVEKYNKMTAEFRDLSAEKFKRETQGGIFQQEERLKELREYLGTYDLTLQGIEAAKKSVAITSHEQRTMNVYFGEGSKKIQKVRSMGDTLSMLLGKLKGDEALRCLANFEYVPGQQVFMENELNEWKKLRFEELEEWKWPGEE